MAVGVGQEESSLIRNVLLSEITSCDLAPGDEAESFT
jgi:hypothetical protein